MWVRRYLLGINFQCRSFFKWWVALNPCRCTCVFLRILLSLGMIMSVVFLKFNYCYTADFPMAVHDYNASLSIKFSLFAVIIPQKLSQHKKCWWNTSVLLRCYFPYRYLQKRMQGSFSSLKLNVLVLDELYNSKELVLTNIFLAALLLAFRFHSIVKYTFDKKNLNQKFLTQIVYETVSRTGGHTLNVTKKYCKGNMPLFILSWNCKLYSWIPCYYT